MLTVELAGVAQVHMYISYGIYTKGCQLANQVLGGSVVKVLNRIFQTSPVRCSVSIYIYIYILYVYIYIYTYIYVI